MRYQYALLQRQTKVAQTREGAREVSMWYIGRDLVTGLAGEDTLEQALEYMRTEGWDAVPEEIGEDAALLKRRRGR